MTTKQPQVVGLRPVMTFPDGSYTDPGVYMTGPTEKAIWREHARLVRMGKIKIIRKPPNDD